jgi:predicted SprT family Zn-dependent metalloprotease
MLTSILTREKLLSVANLARTLMNNHGLNCWGFRFNARKRTLGICVFPTLRTCGRVELSRDFVLANSEHEVLDTILHEIAHALTPGCGHNATWRRKAWEIGARPNRCAGVDVAMPEGHWKATCPGCRKVFSRFRKPKRPTGWHCRVCGRHRGALVWTNDYVNPA